MALTPRSRLRLARVARLVLPVVASALSIGHLRLLAVSVFVLGIAAGFSADCLKKAAGPPVFTYPGRPSKNPDDYR